MLQSRICILVILQEMACRVFFLFCFLIVFRWLISFMKILLLSLQTRTESLIVYFLLEVSKSTDNLILPKCQIRLYCIQMTINIIIQKLWLEV